MQRVVIRDLLCAPNLLTAARFPLALAFPFVAHRPRLALGVVGAAAVTDVLDGFLARRMGKVSTEGAIADGIADKAFAASVVGTLIAKGRLAPVSALLLATREIGELLLVARALARGEAPAQRAANAAGKIATTLELLTVVSVLVGARGRRLLLGVTAAASFVSALSYWVRELRPAFPASPYGHLGSSET